jgi:hypothetical protein
MWRLDLIANVTVNAVRLPLVSYHTAQVYWFNVAVGPPGGQAQMYWSLPHIVGAVYDLQDHQDVLQSMQKTMEKEMARLGIHYGTFRHSRRSQAQLKQKHGADNVAAMDGVPLQYATATTQTCLLYLLHWSYSHGKQSTRHGYAQTILEFIVDHASSGANFDFNVEGVVLRVRDDTIDLSGLDKWHHTAICVCAEKIAEDDELNIVPLASFILGLYTLFRRPSRASSSTNTMTSNLLGRILVNIQNQTEMSIDTSFWSEATLLALQPQARGKRCRSVSMAFKEACVASVKSTGDPLDIRQLLAASGIMSTASSDGTIIATKHHSSTCHRDHCLGTLANARSLFREFQVLHVAHDGVTAADRHNEIFLMLDPATQNFAIMPPKASNNSMSRTKKKMPS